MIIKFHVTNFYFFTPNVFVLYVNSNAYLMGKNPFHDTYTLVTYIDKSYNSLWGHLKYGGYIGALCNGASVLEPDSFTSTDIPIYMSWVSFVFSLCAFIAGVTMTLADSSYVLDMFTLGLSLCSWVELSHSNLLLLWFWSCATTYVTTTVEPLK